ncbi:MAG: DNA alkylation repair protein, partial [Methanobacteriaceae archaeon]|nr:DNA alkylation repair protein [Methanobacteriaceae archaeon]
DDYFFKFFPIIKNASLDNRNFVRKSVSWALRSIGRRNIVCNQNSLDLAYDILEMGSKSSKWVARSVIKELSSDKVQSKFS